MISNFRRLFIRNALFVVPLLLCFGVMACSESPLAPPRGQAPTATTMAAKGADLDGKDYYRGIFFGSGPVAQQIPEIRDNYAMSTVSFTTEERTQAEQVRDRVVSEIESYDPNFYSRFEQVVESGDQLTIQRGLREGGLVTMLAMLRTPEGQQAIGLSEDPQAVHDVTAAINEHGGFGKLSEEEVAQALSQIRTIVEKPDQAGDMIGLCATFAIFTVIYFVAAVHNVVAITAAVAIAIHGAVVVAYAFWVAVWHWIYTSIQPEEAFTSLQFEQMVNSLAKAY